MNTLALRGLEEPAHVSRGLEELFFTLFHSIPLLALKDRQTEEQIHLLRVGWRNLPTLRVGWSNLFSSCTVVSVFGSGGK